MDIYIKTLNIRKINVSYCWLFKSNMNRCCVDEVQSGDKLMCHAIYLLIPLSSDVKFVAQVVIGFMCGVHSDWQI